MNTLGEHVKAIDTSSDEARSRAPAGGSASVQMSLQLMVECPHCGEDHDLTSPGLNDECQFTEPIFDGHDWRDGLRGMEIECPSCTKIIQLGEIDY